MRCVMTAHVVFPAYDAEPATLSPVLLGLLRQDLGFDGVVITDALDMKAISAGVGHAEGAVRSLAAGADLVCIGNPGYPETYDADARLGLVVDAVVAAVEQGRLSVERLEQAAARVDALRAWLREEPAGAVEDAGDVAARAVTRRGDVRVARPRVVDLGGAVNIAAGDRDRHLRDLLEASAGDGRLVVLAQPPEPARRGRGPRRPAPRRRRGVVRHRRRGAGRPRRPHPWRRPSRGRGGGRPGPGGGPVTPFPRLVAGVDLGKTTCRVRALRDGQVLGDVRVPGSRGLADPGGADAARAAIAAGLAVVRREAGLPDDTTFDVLAVGAAGSEAAPGLGRALLTGLPARELALTSDAIISHAGAFSGGAGAVVAVGTGAVAIGLGSRGLVRVDGLGYWLGDDGGGSWIGRRGLRHALDARAGRGPATSLLTRAEARYGDLARLPGTLAAGDRVAAVTAAFAVDVVAAAESGDALARRGPGRRRRGPRPDHHGRGPGERDRRGRCHRRPGARARGPLARPPPRRPHRGRRQPAPPSTVPCSSRSGPTSRTRPTSTVSAAAAARVSGLDLLATEQVRADLADLDASSPERLVDLLLAAEATVPAAVAAARPSIAAAVALAEKALLAGGRLLYVGAGTPGRLAAQDAAEIPPTFGTDPSRVVAILAGGGAAAATAVEGRRGPGRGRSRRRARPRTRSLRPRRRDRGVRPDAVRPRGPARRP